MGIYETRLGSCNMVATHSSLTGFAALAKLIFGSDFSDRTETFTGVDGCKNVADRFGLLFVILGQSVSLTAEN